MIDQKSLFSIVHPTIIKIFLYKHSYKDRIILSEINKRLKLIYLDPKKKDRFFVRRIDIENILVDRFSKDIYDFERFNDDETRKNVSSVLFLTKILEDYPKLKYLEINVIDTEQYSRLNVDGIIWFDYTIVHSKVDLTQSILTQDQRDLFIKAISSAGLYDPIDSVLFKKPYISTNAKDVLDSIIDSIEKSEPEDEEFSGYQELTGIFNNKLYLDNSDLLVILEK